MDRGKKVHTLIKSLTVKELHDRSDVNVDFLNAISIFMGPNGIGKSTILGILVQFLSCQWARLAKQPFVSATIEFPSGQTISVTKAEC